jgi:hypothetical protein
VGDSLFRTIDEKEISLWVWTVLRMGTHMYWKKKAWVRMMERMVRVFVAQFESEGTDWLGGSVPRIEAC